MELEKYLDDLETRIDPETEDGLYAQWTEFWDGNFKGDIFTPAPRKTAAGTVDWPLIPINDALNDLEKMTLRELKPCSDILSSGNGGAMCIRCNYGTSILPSLFGMELFVMDMAHDTLPTSLPLTDGADGIRRLLDKGVPDLNSGYGLRVFETAAFFRKTMKKYPKISKYVSIYHPDLQSPMDVCEIIWGSSMFTSLYDEPDLVKSFLELLTQTYIGFMEKWELIEPPEKDGYAVHWGWRHKGRIVLRDDSAMNLSPEMYGEFVRPYDERLMMHFGGGVIHFCGRGDHYIQSMCGIRNLYAVHLSQPHMNDMGEIFKNTVDRGIHIVGFERAVAEHALKTGRDLHGRVHAP